MGRQQKGQLIESESSFSVRYYAVQLDGSIKQKSVFLCHKSAIYRTAEDVEVLRQRVMDNVNLDQNLPTGRATIEEFFSHCYMPWVKKTKAASTQEGYMKLFRKLGKLKDVAMADLTTPMVTRWLTKLSGEGLKARSVGHSKWHLSGIFEHAVALGVVGFNPVPAAKSMAKTERQEPCAVYSLPDVLRMIALLEPVSLQAAVAVALSFFAGLRPGESKGLRWRDWHGDTLTIRCSVWRGIEGRPKTESSAATIPCIEPLRGLLAKLHGSHAPEGYILVNSVGHSLDLDTLATRVIVPTLRRSGIKWSGYYAGRRGISSLVTASSKDALNATGLLRHSTPLTALQHYTRASKDDVAQAMKGVESMAMMKPETVQ